MEMAMMMLQTVTRDESAGEALDSLERTHDHSWMYDDERAIFGAIGYTVENLAAAMAAPAKGSCPGCGAPCPGARCPLRRG